METLHLDPIVSEYNSNDGVHTTIRRRTTNAESGIHMFILERTDMGVTPQQILRVLGHIKNFTKANKNLKECVILDEVDLRDGDPIVQIYGSIIKPPSALIAGRFFVDAKYLWTGDMMCLMSSEGN